LGSKLSWCVTIARRSEMHDVFLELESSEEYREGGATFPRGKDPRQLREESKPHRTRIPSNLCYPGVFLRSGGPAEPTPPRGGGPTIKRSLLWVSPRKRSLATRPTISLCDQGRYGSDWGLRRVSLRCISGKRLGVSICNLHSFMKNRITDSVLVFECFCSVCGLMWRCGVGD